MPLCLKTFRVEYTYLAAKSVPEGLRSSVLPFLGENIPVEIRLVLAEVVDDPRGRIRPDTASSQRDDSLLAVALDEVGRPVGPLGLSLLLVVLLIGPHRRDNLLSPRIQRGDPR